jgi:hypothetical protein
MSYDLEFEQKIDVKADIIAQTMLVRELRFAATLAVFVFRKNCV